MKILWASICVQNQDDVWEPRIQATRAANGWFPCRWSITSGKRGNKFAVGIADVNPAQLAALEALPGVPIVEQADWNNTFGSLPIGRRVLINQFCDNNLITRPTNDEVLQSFWDRAALAAGNKGFAKIDQELTNSQKASISPLVIPAVTMAAARNSMSRRTLLKAAAITVGGIFLLKPKTARSSVVFSDAFAVGADINLEDYPSGTPDYAYNRIGGGDHLYVNAVADRVQMYAAISDTYATARIIDASVPTGDQLITVTGYGNGAASRVLLSTRLNASGTGNYYEVMFFPVTGDPAYMVITRYDDASGTNLVVEDRALTFPATLSFKAVGTGAQVDLTVTADGVADLTTSDLDALRKTSGPPGIGLYEDPGAGDVAYIDNLTVDDLSVPSTTIRRRGPIIQ